MSASTSAWIPPSPTMTTGPNVRSRTQPTISSTPSERSAIASTETAGGAEPGRPGRRTPRAPPPRPRPEHHAAGVGLVHLPERLEHQREPSRGEGVAELARSRTVRGGGEGDAGVGEQPPRDVVRRVGDRRCRLRQLRRTARRGALDEPGQHGAGPVDVAVHRDPGRAQHGGGRAGREDRVHDHRLVLGRRRRGDRRGRPPARGSCERRPARWSSRRSSRSSAPRPPRRPPSSASTAAGIAHRVAVPRPGEVDRVDHRRAGPRAPRSRWRVPRRAPGCPGRRPSAHRRRRPRGHRRRSARPPGGRASAAGRAAPRAGRPSGWDGRRGRTPPAAQAASTTCEELVIEPVCETALRAAASDRPGESSTTGFPASRRARAAVDEPPAVDDVLGVDRDRARAGVVHARMHQLDHGEVGLVAQRDEPRDPQPALDEQRREVEDQVAALAEHRHLAGGQHGVAELQAGAGVRDARGSWGRRAPLRRPGPGPPPPPRPGRLRPRARRGPR